MSTGGGAEACLDAQDDMVEATIASVIAARMDFMFFG